MLLEKDVTEFRSKVREYYNKVYVGRKPMVLTRKRGEHVVAMHLDDLRTVLDSYRFKVTVRNEADNAVATLEGLDLWGIGETPDAAISDLASDLRQYAEDYYQRSELFLNSPNRRHHFPWILRVLLCDRPEDVGKLFEVVNA